MCVCVSMCVCMYVCVCVYLMHFQLVCMQSALDTIEKKSVFDLSNAEGGVLAGN